MSAKANSLSGNRTWVFCFTSDAFRTELELATPTWSCTLETHWHIPNGWVYVTTKSRWWEQPNEITFSAVKNAFFVERIVLDRCTHEQRIYFHSSHSITATIKHGLRKEGVVVVVVNDIVFKDSWSWSNDKMMIF